MSYQDYPKEWEHREDWLGADFNPRTTHLDHALTLQALEASYHSIPTLADSDWPRNGVTRHPVATPPSYPNTVSPVLENPALFERLDGDVLFFSFYYQQVRPPHTTVKSLFPTGETTSYYSQVFISNR